MVVTEQLATFLGDFSNLVGRIKHLHYDTTLCGERVDVRCSYVAFKDGKQTFDEFIDVLYNQITSFCLPKSEIRREHAVIAEALKAENAVLANQIMSQLTERARNLFMKARKGSHRSGEAGEILLFILVEWLLEAPQIVSKMYLKTNNNMPVHGTDGIHAKFDEATKRLFLYWGESKAYKTLSGGFGSAMSSIRGFLDSDGQKNEILIVSSHSDFNGASPAAKAAFISYLDPYSEDYNQCITVFACLLVFEFSEMEFEENCTGDSEEAFTTAVNGAVKEFIEDLTENLEGHELGNVRFEFFLVPVPSVQGFRDKFQKKLGWPDD